MVSKNVQGQVKIGSMFIDDVVMGGIAKRRRNTLYNTGGMWRPFLAGISLAMGRLRRQGYIAMYANLHEYSLVPNVGM